MRTGDPRLAVGLLVGAVFGTVFVEVNAGPPLAAPVVSALRVLAVVLLVAVVAAVVRGLRTGAGGGPVPPAPRGAMFGRGYLGVVAVELVLLLGGLRFLRAAEVTEEANVAWVALVVGLHFVALAVVWRAVSVAVPGGALTGLGAAGLAMAAAGEPAWVPFVSGVLSGLVLLAGSLAAATLPGGGRGMQHRATLYRPPGAREG